MNNMRRLVILPIAMLVLAACQGGGQSSAPAAEESEPPATESPAASEPATSVGAAAGVPCDEASGDDALARVCEAGVLVISTDPAYPPQSSLNTETGEYEGFDIDVATEIANRLGVEVAWEAPSWDVITAGSWNGRWATSCSSPKAAAWC